jgi:hypothetical protein
MTCSFCFDAVSQAPCLMPVAPPTAYNPPILTQPPYLTSTSLPGVCSPHPLASFLVPSSPSSRPPCLAASCQAQALTHILSSPAGLASQQSRVMSTFNCLPVSTTAILQPLIAARAS